MKQKRIITEDFFLGNLGDLEATNEILNAYNKTFGKDVNEVLRNDYSAAVGGEEKILVDHKIRKCYISWLSVSESNFIEHGLKKILENVNNISWKMNLDHCWSGDIQFTKYIGKGDHYDWHKDYYRELSERDGIKLRRLSIVYCLSKKSDYTGGEFQIRTNNGGVYTSKFDFGDFIVFPSNKLHRVKPLKSGNRITMVGWYK